MTSCRWRKPVRRQLPRTKAFGVLPMVDHKYIYKRAQELLDRVGLAVKPTAMVETLSISQKQLVEIAKALAANAKVLIMDEPTSSLNLDEVENLFKIIRSLKESGVGIVYISHKMRELREIGDRITVLKDGRTVATKNIEDVASDEEIVSMMVGRELKNNYFNREMSHVKDKVIFEAKNIVRRDRRVNDVSFTLREGEILGFAGLVGAGRTELMNVIFGAERMQSGEIWLDGRRIFVRSPYHSIKDGIGMITENRRETGFMHNFEIWRNIAVARSLKQSRLEGTWGLSIRTRDCACRTVQQKNAGQMHQRDADDHHAFRRQSAKKRSLANGWPRTPACSSLMSRPAALTSARKTRFIK